MKKLPERSSRQRWLTAEEARRLVQAAAEHLQPLILVALNTGSRKSELLKLKWTEVDLASRTLSFLDTKSGRRRDVIANDIVVETLSGLPRESEWVFTYMGRPMNDVKTAFRTACRRAGIAPGFRYHDLRHCYASHATMAGMDQRALQEQLGHQSLAMTQRYSHLAGDHRLRVANLVSLGIEDDRVGEVVVPFRMRRTGSSSPPP